MIQVKGRGKNIIKNISGLPERGPSKTYSLTTFFYWKVTRFDLANSDGLKLHIN